jgi:hypothetical protein
VRVLWLIGWRSIWRVWLVLQVFSSGTLLIHRIVGMQWEQYFSRLDYRFVQRW